jgi:hypothetical protein
LTAGGAVVPHARRAVGVRDGGAARIDPGSKLAVESWVADEVFIPGLDEVDVQQLYRAMDVLLGAHDEIQRRCSGG